MKIKKTWLTVHFIEADVEIEATLNYSTRNFSLTHGSNDENVTYKSSGENAINDMDAALRRNKCVTAALNFIKKELDL